MSGGTGRWQRLETLFHAALERPAHERAAFLDAVCGADSELRREIEHLLAADDRAHSRIQKIVAGGAARAADALALTPGTDVGPYRLDRELGQGGMGSVWLGHKRDDPERPVAIKLLRPGLASPGILRRFHVEQRILADLVHTNIAQLIDGGTITDDRPWFVMEYVEGEPIDVWATDRALDVHRRIDLVLDVCAAVQFAHTRQIIHRDLKPGNILVTGDGTPKLLDFGIAKLLGPAAAQAMQTAPGVRLMTLRYASPEQIRGAPVSPATDIYSLGVVLYELLTERSPYAFDREDAVVLADAILGQEPRPPSALVRNPHLRSQLAGELDSLLLTALQKEPDRRFRSIEQFAGQLRRYRQRRAPS
jgi:serine/threonine protein kinase